MLVTIPTMTKRYIDELIAEKNKNNLLKKPASGGIPAVENNIIAKLKANKGFAWLRPFKSAIVLLLRKDTTTLKVPIVRTI